jgi:hypothetical protein
MKKFAVIPFVLLAVLIMTSAVFANGFGGAPRVTNLYGSEEAPGPGDPDGFGYAHITLNPGQQMVCWQISYENIVTPNDTQAHIHRAPVGSPGPIVVRLNPNQPGCVSASYELIKEIIEYPERFYVNVHNAVYPGGAIRGQLSNPGQSN